MSDNFHEHEHDFTEAHYRELLRLAKQHYRFVTFTEEESEEKSVLWRHDLDFSPQRALRLAQIEAEEGIRATYFVLLHSEFYNALEREVVRVVQDVAALGHAIGLHFDPQFYGATGELDALLRLERHLLQTTLGLPIDAFSWHNPSQGDWIESTHAASIGGMVNAYSRAIRERFSYISDSHGVWRFRRLRDVLAAAEERHLHVLTHPEWWMPEAMPPRDRITRAIDGRAARNERFYDEVLAAIGRPNGR
ncbi:MAG TPA: hypothetical protein VF215_15860 [Thermoanaerobaculia bacterium]